MFCILMYCLGVCELYGQSQQIICEQLDITNGLSQNGIQAMIQDKQGVMWFGTQDGLNCFDAYSMNVYKRVIGNDSTSITDNFISCLYEDSQKRLWVGTEKGVCNFEKPYLPRFINFTIPGTGSNLVNTSQEITSIVSDNDDNIFIASRSGLFLYSGRDQKAGKHALVAYNHPFNKELSRESITAMVVDKYNALWIGTSNNGLIKIRVKLKNDYQHFQTSSSGRQDLFSNQITHLYRDSQDRIWVANAGGLNCYNPGKGAWEADLALSNSNSQDAMVLPSGAISSIVEAKDGTLWIAVGELVCNYDIKNKKLSTYSLAIKDGSSSDHGIVDALTVDTSGILWIGTQNAGVLKYDPFLARFELFKRGNLYPNILDTDNVWGIHETPEKLLLVNTEKAINVIDRVNRKNTVITRSVSGEAITENEILQVSHLFGDTYTLGLRGDGITFATFSPDKQKILKLVKHRPNKQNTAALPDGLILTQYKDKKGNLWCGSYGGLSLINLVPEDLSKTTFTNFKADPSNPNALHDNVVRTIYQDKNSYYWVGTNNGLYKIKFDNQFQIQEVKEFIHNPKDSQSISHNKVQYITEDKDGFLWICTGGGVNKLDIKTEKFKLIGQETQAAQAIVYALVFDEDNNVWFSSNNGLIKYNPQNNTSQLFNNRDGLQSNEFNSGSLFKSSSGEIFFGGIKGFNAFFPRKIQPSGFVPPIFLKDIKVNNQSVYSSDNKIPGFDLPASEITEIRLKHDQNTITFEFSALNYRLTEKTEYMHMMEGIDTAWVNDGKNRVITYNELSSGTYVLNICATNSDGESDKEKNKISIRIYIDSPIYEEPYFLLFLVVLVIAIIFLIIHLKTRSSNLYAKKLEEEVNKRTLEIVQKNKELTEKTQQIEESFANIRTLSEIAQKITAILDVSSLITSIYDYVATLVQTSGFGIGLLDKDQQYIEFTGFMENGKKLPDSRDYLADKNRLSVWCCKNNSEVFIIDYDLEINNYITAISMHNPEDGEPMQSIIYLPLTIEGRIIGVITVQSLDKNAYTTQDLDLLRSLAATVSIALSNAKAYESVEVANKEIQRKNVSLQDSLRYAKTIQQALLPTEIERYFTDCFILFKPRETVSGDFYWSVFAENKVFIAVVDCTGHGVPGAFIALVGRMLLGEIVEQKHITAPSEILSMLHNEVRTALQQQDKKNDDGMDVCLCSVEEMEEDARYRINFAGAKRPLYYIKDGEWGEIHGDKRSIAGDPKPRTFTQHSLEVKKGDKLYFTTDGFVDQNNPEREKIGSSNLKRILLEIADNDMIKQRKTLLARLDKHRGTAEQRDDITIIGLKI